MSKRILGMLAALLLACGAMAAEPPARGLTVAAAAVQGAEAGLTYHLLVIGIDKYLHWPQLGCAVQDAKGVKAALVEGYGFDDEHCVELYDAAATEAGIVGALRTYARTLTESDALLIYYAGHGHLDDLTDKGSWVPVDANETNSSSWISNQVIKDLLKAMKARHVLLISDSCFSGDFFRGQTRSKGVTVTDAYARSAYGKRARQAITSGGIEPVADDDGTGHSVFANFLLRALREHKEPYLVPTSLFERIKGGVVANAEQQPQLGILHGTGGEVGGEFVLFRKQVGDLTEALEQNQARLAKLRELEAAAKGAAAREAAEQAEKEAALAKLDEEIAALQKRLGAGDAAAGSLDELVALADRKKDEAARLVALRQKAVEEKAAREAEIARLKTEALERRQADWESDHEKYRKVFASPHLDETIKDQAWTILAKKWQLPEGELHATVIWDARANAPTSNIGTIVVSSRDLGGEVMVNGKSRGTLAAGGEVRVAGVIGGTATVALITAGEPQRQRTATVEKGQVCLVHFSGMRVPQGFIGAPGAESEPYTGTRWAQAILHGQSGMEFVFVPAGDFVMGTGSGFNDVTSNAREVQHPVRISSGFYLGKYEVTRSQWQKLMGTNSITQAQSALNDTQRYGGKTNREWCGVGATQFVLGATINYGENNDATAMAFVNWQEAGSFCQRLGQGFRLPTEAEWEYACRAGTRGMSWQGDFRVLGQNNAPALDPIAWYGGNSSHGFVGYGMATNGWSEKQYSGWSAGARRVGQKAANPWGLHDMLGNVTEWCADWYGAYPTERAVDPKGPGAGTQRILRGGSWYSPAKFVRAGSREFNDPNIRLSYNGFRVAYDPQLP